MSTMTEKMILNKETYDTLMNNFNLAQEEIVGLKKKLEDKNGCIVTVKENTRNFGHEIVSVEGSDELATKVEDIIGCMLRASPEKLKEFQTEIEKQKAENAKLRSLLTNSIEALKKFGMYAYQLENLKVTTEELEAKLNKGVENADDNK